MCGLPSNDSSEPSAEFAEFEKLHGLVVSDFDVEEWFVEHGAPTFYVRLRRDSKQAFLRLFRRLNAVGFAPVLRRREGKVVLQIVRKPPSASSRWIINVVLFLATIGTMLVSGYFLSVGWMHGPIVGAVMFTAAIVAILGVHEMSHKFAARRHDVEASYPYFIPGPPAPYGIGTFGAVIQQKSLAPNKDALFDLGISGPVVGFFVTIVVTIVGVQLSRPISLAEANAMGAQFLRVPILFNFVATMFPPVGLKPNYVLLLHPVAFAGWVGMLVTMLNLVPTGMLDGGHAVRGLFGQRARNFLSFLAILILLALGHYPMAIIAFVLSLQRHPGPLDDVSGLSVGRKLVTIVLVLIFVLTATPA